jgi:uncharacterized protein YoaH (UPF0181 family)
MATEEERIEELIDFGLTPAQAAAIVAYADALEDEDEDDED